MILEVRIKKLFLFLIILNFSCDTEPNYTVLKGSTFGTYYQIKYFEHDKTNPIIDKEIDSIFDHFNSSLSTYISSSIISKVNKNEEVLLDDLFIDVFKKSKIIHEKTNGYFDPSIGTLLEYAGFGPKKTENIISEDSLNIVLSLSLIHI